VKIEFYRYASNPPQISVQIFVTSPGQIVEIYSARERKKGENLPRRLNLLKLGEKKHVQDFCGLLHFLPVVSSNFKQKKIIKSSVETTFGESRGFTIL